MSRRKQGKPQQRKAFNSLDDENDLLVCGFCQRNFLLHDIVKFIHHKVNRCNKENVDVLSCSSGHDRDGERLSNCSDMDDDDDDESIRDEPFITSKQTSISAPISRKESLDRDVKYSPRLIEPRRELLASIENMAASVKRESTSSIESCSSPEDIKPQHVDAESNTTNSEPFNHVCDTCKHTFNSAWSLVQHAQNEHQLKIYWSPPPPPTLEVIRTPPKPPSVERRTPHYEHRTPPKEHRTPPCLSLGPFTHPAHHPFLFPMPVPEHPHHTLSPALPHGQFSRPPGPEFGLDSMIRDPFHLRPSLPGITAPYNPAIHSAFELPRSSLSDPAFDLFSTRLKRLARPHSPTPRPNPFMSNVNSSNSLPPPTTSSPKNQLQSPEQIPKGMPTAKLKSCEFCGKCFRFQSNLIVHRRSHTGEKPFKCPLCPHACTQASKLKRHMKTHMNKSPLSSLSHGSNMSNASEGSELSNSSTPDSTKHRKGEDLDEDEGSEDELEDEEEEEEEEVFEDDLEEEDMEEDSNMDVADEDGPKCRPYYSPAMMGHHYPPGMMMGQDVPSSRPKDLSMLGGIVIPPDNQSLLNEVMQNTGLNHIQQYHEAFQQALAENITGAKQRRTPPEANAGRTTPAINGEQETEKQRSRSADVSPVFLHNEKPHLAGEPITPRFVGECSPPVHNLIKREPRDSINSLDTLASRSIWFPPTVPPRSLYLPSMALNRDPHFGRVNQTPPDSAFKYIGSSPKPGPSTNCADTNGCTPHRKSLRNDKCEYCGKIFKNCSNLTVHRRSHTGEKPYKCRMCNYACAQSSKLTRHMRTHGRMGKDVYRCKFCSMPFSVPSTLEKHMRKCVDNRHCHPYHEADNDTNGI